MIWYLLLCTYVLGIAFTVCENRKLRKVPDERLGKVEKELVITPPKSLIAMSGIFVGSVLLIVLMGLEGVPEVLVWIFLGIGFLGYVLMFGLCLMWYAYCFDETGFIKMRIFFETYGYAKGREGIADIGTEDTKEE